MLKIKYSCAQFLHVFSSSDLASIKTLGSGPTTGHSFLNSPLSGINVGEKSVWLWIILQFVPTHSLKLNDWNIDYVFHGCTISTNEFIFRFLLISPKIIPAYLGSMNTFGWHDNLKSCVFEQSLAAQFEMQIPFFCLFFYIRAKAAIVSTSGLHWLADK